MCGEQLEALVRERDRLDRAEGKALNALCRISPATPAGASVLIAYVCEDMKDGAAEWQRKALANASKALAKMK